MSTAQRRPLARSKQSQGQTLSLKGSTKLVFEFFEYSVNSILYSRGVYDPDDFRQVKKYGLTLFTSADEQLESYIHNVMKKAQGNACLPICPIWLDQNGLTGGSRADCLCASGAVLLLSNQLKSLALVIMTRDTKETVERWQFDIQTNDTPTSAAVDPGADG